MTDPLPYSTQPSPTPRRWPIILAVCVGFVVGGGVGAGVTVAFTSVNEPESATEKRPTTTQFERAHEDCGSPDFIEVLDKGNGLDIQSEGEETTGASFVDVECVLAELKTPESIKRRIDNTRAMDGTQTATWSGISASWTYHPDDGLSMVLDLANSGHSQGS